MPATQTETKPKVENDSAYYEKLFLEFLADLKERANSLVYELHGIWKKTFSDSVEFNDFTAWLSAFGKMVTVDLDKLCEAPRDYHLNYKWIRQHLNANPERVPNKIAVLAEMYRDHDDSGAPKKMTKMFRETTKGMSKKRIVDFYENMAD